jgi:hypothetical protein
VAAAILRDTIVNMTPSEAIYMPVIDISQFEHCVVIHFDTDDRRINAYTLASTLTSLADAAKAANNALNAGYETEVVIEALAPGSFRAQMRALYINSENLFTHEVVLTAIIGVISNYMYERTLSLSEDVVVKVSTNEVIIQHEHDRVIVPRTIYEATRKAEKNPQFVRAMTRAFGAVANDDKVKSLGLVPNMKSPAPEIVVPKASLQALSADVPEDPDLRVMNEPAEIQIVKAILEKSKRKWEFMWHGIKISAPITDTRFYVNFFAHDITIAPGDTLKVILAIKQTKDPETGIYINISYEVVEVQGHIPQIRQIPLPSMDDEG